MQSAPLKRQGGRSAYSAMLYMNVTPFFEFVLVMVGIGTLAILLTAVLLTARP